MFSPKDLRGVVVICGHYGVGKTNLALNLCVDAARAGVRVTCADFDIVNPYFRSSDYRGVLEEAGVEVIAPLFSGTSLDSPGLSGKLIGAIQEARGDENHLLIIDAGGDDVGATALGRFARDIEAGEYTMIYVVNAYRNLTRTPQEAVAFLPEIQAASHLRATHVLNNSHLQSETSDQLCAEAAPFGLACAELLGLPLLAQTVPHTCDFATCADKFPSQVQEIVYPVQTLVTTPWER